MVLPAEIQALRLSDGVARHLSGDLAGAEAIYDQIIAQNAEPAECAEALRLLGVLNIQKNRLHAAIELLERGLAVAPDNPVALDNLGVALKGLKHYGEAIVRFDRALELQPDNLQVQNNRAITLFEARQFEASLDAYRKVLSACPGHLGALNDCALVLKALERRDEALACLDMAAAISPDDVKTLCNRGVTLREMDRHGEALDCYDRALAIAPTFAEAYHNRGNLLLELCKPHAALVDYERALALAPGMGEFAFSKSVCLLQLGDLKEGLALYENRKARPPHARYFATRAYSQPSLRPGDDIEGKALFLYWEQGYGDTLQFCRFAKMVEALGAKVMLSVQNRLHEVLKSLSPTIELVDEAGAPDAFDIHAPLTSMALYFGVDLASLPGETDYLHADPKRVEQWREKIGDGGFKIGVNWHGNAENTRGLHRSFSLRDLAPLAALDGVRLISLQKFAGVEQLQDLPEGFRVEAFDAFDAGGDAFVDTAAIMENLDLVITCDTALAHLAGALGRPAWLALRHAPEWRWLLDRNDSPWYPSLRLFRQEKAGDWAGLFEDMAQSLDQSQRERKAPNAFVGGRRFG